MKRKRISFLAMLMLSVILLMPASIQASTRPGAVKLTKITAVDYNKINIKWKKSSDATNYIVYYKEAGNSKWIKLKTLGSTKSTYTHSSSRKYPINVGQKYQYTVKAYNKDTKKYGHYNTKGLTVTASLKMVTGIEAKIEGTTVKLTWNKVSGANKYAIYAKIPSLTVAEIKNRCIPCVYWDTAIFIVVMKYSNLFFSFAFFLDRSHFAFGYELIISSEAAGFMKIICNGFTLI